MIALTILSLTLLFIHIREFIWNNRKMKSVKVKSRKIKPIEILEFTLIKYDNQTTKVTCI